MFSDRRIRAIVPEDFFKQILASFHPQYNPSKRNEAQIAADLEIFLLLKENEKALRIPKPVPLTPEQKAKQPPPMPETEAEWQELKRRATAERKAKRQQSKERKQGGRAIR
jgi:hypothetical protein